MKQTKTKTKTKTETETKINNILICSGVGRQGKSTMSRHVFPDFDLVSWDTVNLDRHGNRAYRVKDANDFMQALFRTKRTTVFDVGASEWQNLGKVLLSLHNSFSHIILMIKPEDSEDAVQGLKTLLSIPGIDKTKIRIFINATGENSNLQLEPFLTFTEKVNFDFEPLLMPFSKAIQTVNKAGRLLSEVAAKKDEYIKAGTEAATTDSGINIEAASKLSEQITLAYAAEVMLNHCSAIRKQLDLPPLK